MIPEDILRMLFGLLSLIPFSYFIQYIPTAKLRYIYSLVLGLIIQYFVYMDYMYPIYLQHLIIYGIIKFKK